MEGYVAPEKMYHIVNQFVSPSGEFPFVDSFEEGPTRQQATQTYDYGGLTMDAETQTDPLTSVYEPLPKLTKQLSLVDQRERLASQATLFTSRIRCYAIQDDDSQENLYYVHIRHTEAPLSWPGCTKTYSIIVRHDDDSIVLKMLTRCLGKKMTIFDVDDKVIAEVSRGVMPVVYRVRWAHGSFVCTFRREGKNAYKVVSPDELILGDVRRQETLQGGGPPDKFFHPKLFISFSKFCDMRTRALITCTSFYVIVCEQKRFG